MSTYLTSKVFLSYSQYSEIDIWFASPREISRKLLDFHHDGMRMGHIDTAMYSLVLAWRYRLFGGENLAIISQSAEDRLKLAVRTFIIFDVCNSFMSVGISCHSISILNLTMMPQLFP